MQQIIWSSAAWEDYLYWQATDPKLVRRINQIIRDTMRTPFSGIGAPEPLKFQLSGYWSRRITKEHRLVYKADKNTLYIAQCRFHY